MGCFCSKHKKKQVLSKNGEKKISNNNHKEDNIKTPQKSTKKKKNIKKQKNNSEVGEMDEKNEETFEENKDIEQLEVKDVELEDNKKETEIEQLDVVNDEFKKNEKIDLDQKNKKIEENVINEEEEKREEEEEEKEDDKEKEKEEEKEKEKEEEEENEDEDKKDEEEESGPFSDSSKWREYMADDNNFDQKVPFDFKSISFKLKKAAKNPDDLNPFYTISAIYDFTKFFKDISSALSMGFSDITEKCEIMRKRFKEYPEVNTIQELCNKEIELDVHKLNGDNNKSLGHKKGKYAKYISGCRTFLRLLWFLEYLLDVFKNILKDDGDGKVKKILGNSYDKVLAPHHGFFVRKAVGVALSMSSAGNVSEIVSLVFGYEEYDEEARNTIKETSNLMEIIWKGGNQFYEKNDLLDIK